MKLRIHDNSARLRLSRTDVDRLSRGETLEEKIEFQPGHALSYSLAVEPVDQAGARMEGSAIRFFVPSARAARWLGSAEVGVTGPGVVIEKDFQCLHRESSEDADSFPNPNA